MKIEEYSKIELQEIIDKSYSYSDVLTKTVMLYYAV